MGWYCWRCGGWRAGERDGVAAGKEREGKGERLDLEMMGSWKKREFEDFWGALRNGFRGLWVIVVIGEGMFGGCW